MGNGGKPPAKPRRYAATSKYSSKQRAKMYSR